MTRTFRYSRLLVIPCFAIGVMVVMVDDVRSQPPGGGGFGGGKGGFGGGKGGAPDPDQIWDRMAKGKDSINLNEPQNMGMKMMIERGGDPLPPNGILTKDQFKVNFQKKMASGGFGGGGRGGMGGGGMGGPPGMGGGGMGATPGMPMQPGMAGGGDWIEQRFQQSDLNKDGAITMDEASDRLKPTFSQADKNGDGRITSDEYKTYMNERMGGAPGAPGGPGGPPGMAFQPAPGAPGMDMNSAGRPNRKQEEEEVTNRVSVSRFGKLPKEVPSWFTDFDDDHDGMVGLYEWRRHERKSADFVEMDLNGDGYLTADEWLRHNKLQIEGTPSVKTITTGSASPTPPPTGRGGPSSAGGKERPGRGEDGKKGEKPNDKSGKGPGKRNPFEVSK